MRSRYSFSWSSISPNFIMILVAVGLAGGGAYFMPSGFAVFLFVVAGWLASLCLHEFGHAFMAYLGGDYTTAEQGYLTLDPLKYTHPFLSIIFPLLIMATGGIGLPGGAVYINLMLLRDRRWQSLTSAAGPLATLACFAVLWIPFLLGFDSRSSHLEFWAACALLAYLQLTAFFLNLLPIPGLDGFGILEPWLSADILEKANIIRPFGFLILYGLFAYVPAVSGAFFSAVSSVAGLLQIDLYLVFMGLNLFRFWL